MFLFGSTLLYEHYKFKTI